MLCANENDTYISQSLRSFSSQHSKILAVVGRNEIVGAYGQCFDALMARKSLRKCQIKGFPDVGNKLPNGTWTGVLGMIQKKSIELYLRGEANYEEYEDFKGKSLPIHMERVVIGHQIRSRDNLIFYFNLLQNFNIGFSLTVVYGLTFISIFTFSLLISHLTRRIRLKEKRAFRVSNEIGLTYRNFQNKRLSAIGILFLFTHLFLWMNQLFLTNNIKTNKVVVDLSNLIKDEEDIFRNPMVACLFQEGQLGSMIARLPERHILSRIVKEKTRFRSDMQEEKRIAGKEHCLLAKSPRVFQLLQSDLFIVGQQQGRNMLLSFSGLLEGVFDRVWGSKSLFEYPLVMYFNSEKPRIGQEIKQHTEHGMFRRFYECTDEAARTSSRRAKFNLYENVEDYIRAFSSFSNLVLANFHAIFTYFALFCSNFFLIFCVHQLLKFLIKSRCRW